MSDASEGSVERWFRLDLAYDGTEYAGWQRQPGVFTIQQRLEESLTTVLGERTKIVGSGRTDAGVHASMQVASFSTRRWRATADRMVYAVNRHLPDDIVVRNCRDGSTGFHALRDAIGKRYRYTIRCSQVIDPFLGRYHWHFPRPLDFEGMRQASIHLVGQHDFRTFQAQGAPRKSTVRHVRSIEISQSPALDGIDWKLEIEANGFLYNMVRKIVGSLVVVGTQREKPEWIRKVMDSRDPLCSGPTAPPQGLCLIDVEYPESCFPA